MDFPQVSTSIKYSSYRFGFSDAVDEYHAPSYQCTGSEVFLTDCPENNPFNCVADSADHALAVRCGDLSGGGNNGGDGNVRGCAMLFIQQASSAYNIYFS